MTKIDKTRKSEVENYLLALIKKNKGIFGYHIDGKWIAIPVNTLFAHYKAQYPKTYSQEEFDSAISTFVEDKSLVPSKGKFDGSDIEADYLMIGLPKNSKSLPK